jgi:hypothetical protein
MAFSFLKGTVSDMVESNKQYAAMAIYWGTACNSLQAQLNALMGEWQKTGLHKLIEVPNDEMDRMREHLIIGIPVFFSRYSDGVTKSYPIPSPEEECHPS